MRGWWMVLALMLLPVGGAYAADPTLPEPLLKLQKDGAKFTYLGRDLGVDGWLAEQNDTPQYFYVTPDRNAFFLGVLFNKNGRAVTFDQLKKLNGQAGAVPQDLVNAPSQKTEMVKVAASSNSPGEKLYAAAQAAAGFTMGPASAPEAQVFIDPLCPHCKEMLTAVWPSVEAGKLRLRIIPIGAIAPASTPMSAYLLRAPDAPARLQKLMAGDVSAVPTTNDAPTAPVMDNTKILLDWKLNSVPVTLYRGQDGKIKLIEGPPKDMAAFLKDLT